MPAWLRSALTTFVVTLVSLVPIEALSGGDLTWVQTAITAAALAAVRTLVVALNPTDSSYGVGSDSGVADGYTEDAEVSSTN
jgi:hypothetical protein